MPPTPIVIPMQIPGRMSWAGEAGNQAGSVAAAFAAPQAAAKFDFLTEWRHTVGRITATHVWPEQTLNSFTEFPPP